MDVVLLVVNVFPFLWFQPESGILQRRHPATLSLEPVQRVLPNCSAGLNDRHCG
jgi:hypothetical protein